MYDILIPYVRNDSGELEACKALIEKNFLPRDIHVLEKHEKSPYLMAPHIDQIMKIKWAIENLDLTDWFYLFNDDFFVMEPVNGTPYYHRGLLVDQIQARRRTEWYKASLIKTSEILGPAALSYELHVPFLMEKHKLYALIELFDLETADVPHVRSLYGNVFGVGGLQIEDVKNIHNYKRSTYLSTTESTFKFNDIGKYIRSQI